MQEYFTHSSKFMLYREIVESDVFSPLHFEHALPSPRAQLPEAMSFIHRTAFIAHIIYPMYNHID